MSHLNVDRLRIRHDTGHGSVPDAAAYSVNGAVVENFLLATFKIALLAHASGAQPCKAAGRYPGRNQIRQMHVEVTLLVQQRIEQRRKCPAHHD